MLELTRRRTLTAFSSILGTANLAEARFALSEPAPSTSCTPPTSGWAMVPEFKSGAPERTSFLEPGVAGDRLNLTGRVLSTRCEPVPGARLELWHTDLNGRYDYEGYKFRGFQLTDKAGRYHLETVMPGYYSPIRHIHFLLGATIPTGPGAILLANVIEFPTEAEIQRIPETHPRSRRVLPNMISRESGISTASYDIVLSL